MKLLVECGATKSDWTVLDSGNVRYTFKTEGLNFSSGEDGFIGRTLEQGILKTLDACDGQTPDEVFFYAAGLFASDDESSPCSKLRKRLAAYFPAARTELADDLLAAARSVCGNNQGIACILGTGSNTCLFNGSRIVRKIPSGGFILGDEGSASALGRVFISDYIKGLVPECVALAFEEKYDMSYASLVQKIYHGASPAGFLGSLAPDILAFYGENHYMTHLVDSNFRAFIDRSLKPLLSEKVPIGVVGSFGWACRSIISEIGKQEGVEFARFTASPSAGLIEYHKQA